MKKLNICLINDSFPPTIDGVANTVVNYGTIINRELGYATVATPAYPDVDDSGIPFPVIRYPSVPVTKPEGYRAGYPFSLGVLNRLEESGFDLIHAHCPLTATILGRALRRRIDVPLVLTYHTKFDIEIAKMMHGKLLQESATKMLVNVIEACDEIWVVSRGAGENLRKLGFQGECLVMPNGVDFPKTPIEDALIREVTGGCDLPEDVPMFLFVGRMMWYKGVRLILDALAALHGEGRDFRMVFVGGGADREQIVQYADTLAMGQKVCFVEPELDRDRLHAWYSRADLFLFPSTFDTNGLVVGEAAASALASVLVKDSCAAENVTDGVNGFLVEENAASLAALLRRIMDDRALLRRIGQNAQRDLYLSWDDAVHMAYERYGTVIENYRSSGESRRNRDRHASEDEWL